MKFKYKDVVVVNNDFYVNLRGIIREVDDVNSPNPKYLVYLFDGERIWVEEKYIKHMNEENKSSNDNLFPESEICQIL